MRALFFKFRSLLVMSLLILCGGFTGLIFSTNASAQFTCPEDECEDTWLGDDCVDNPGEATYCEVTGSDCKTKACSC